jgi:hypothetical protein
MSGNFQNPLTVISSTKGILFQELQNHKMLEISSVVAEVKIDLFHL